MKKVSLPARNLSSSSSALVAARQVYDAIVIGPQLGGAVAGALLARRGLRVLHVTGEIEGHGTDFSPLFPPFKALPAAHAVLEELGLTVELTRALRPLSRGIQLLGPGHRLDIPPEGTGRTAELRREFGAEITGQVERALSHMADRAQKADNFFRAPPRLPPEGLIERFKLRGAAKEIHGLWEHGDDFAELPETHPLREAVEALWRFTSHLEPDGQAPLALARTAGLILRSPHRYPGGRHGLAESIRKRVLDHGGDLLGERGKPAQAEELLMDGDRVVGVRVAGSANEFRSRAVVLATDAAALRTLVPLKRRARRYAAVLDSARTHYGVAALDLEIEAAGLPEGLAEAALYLEPGSAPPAERAVLIQVLPSPRAGDRILSAAALYRADKADSATEHQNAARRLRAVLDEVCPFLDRHLRASNGAAGDSGAPGHTVFDLDRTHYLSVTGLEQRTPYKNLILACREVIPGLGLEGEFLAGRAAAALVETLVRKRDPLKG